MRLLKYVTVALVAAASTVSTVSATAVNPFHAIQMKEQSALVHKIMSETLPATLAKVHANVASVHERVNAHLSSNKHFHAASAHAKSMMKVQAVSAGCESALTALQTKAESCGQTFSGDWKSSSYTQANIAATCTSTCFTDISTLMNNMYTACKDDNLFDGSANDPFASATSDLAIAQSLIRTICVKDPTDSSKYCFPTFISDFGSISTSSSSAPSFTVSTLATYCTPCTEAVFAAISTVDQTATQGFSSIYRMLCAKDASAVSSSNTQGFCYPSFASLSSSSSTPSYEAICSPCGKKMLTFVTEMGGMGGMTAANVDSLNKIMKLVCLRNEKGNLCFDPAAVQNLSHLMPASDKPGDACYGINPNAGCPSSTCVAAMKASVDSQGCCLSSLLDFVIDFLKNPSQYGGSTSSSSGQVDVGQLQDALNQMKSFFADCGAPMQPSCSVTKSVNAIFQFNNLKYDYYTNNKDKVEAALKKDIAAIANQPVTMVRINSVKPAASSTATPMTPSSVSARLSLLATTTSSGVTVDSSIAVSSDSEVSKVTSNVAAATATPAAADSAFPSTNSLPAAAKVDPAAASVAPQKATATEQTGGFGTGGNSAFARAASSAMMVIGSIIAAIVVAAF